MKKLIFAIKAIIETYFRVYLNNYWIHFPIVGFCGLLMMLSIIVHEGSPLLIMKFCIIGELFFNLFLSLFYLLLQRNQIIRVLNKDDKYMRDDEPWTENKLLQDTCITLGTKTGSWLFKCCKNQINGIEAEKLFLRMED